MSGKYKLFTLNETEYQVYINGRIRKDGKYVKVQKTDQGSFLDGFPVDRIVASAWITNWYGDHHIKHLDGDINNNDPSNLQWTQFPE